MSATINGLAAGTAYHFRLVATNSVGATVGADAAFETSAGVLPAGSTLPVVSSAAAVGITATGAAAQRRDQSRRGAHDVVVRVRHDEPLRPAHGTQTMTGSARGRSTSGSPALAPGHGRSTSASIAQTSTTLYVGPDATFTTKALDPRRAGGAHAARAPACAPAAHGHASPARSRYRRRCPRRGLQRRRRGRDRRAAPTRSRCASATLRPDCSFGEQVTFARRRLAADRRLRVAVHFTGNAVLLPTPVRSASVRA